MKICAISTCPAGARPQAARVLASARRVGERTRRVPRSSNTSRVTFDDDRARTRVRTSPARPRGALARQGLAFFSPNIACELKFAGRGCWSHAGVGATTHKSRTIDRDPCCSHPVDRCCRSVRSSRPSPGARRPISESASPSATSGWAQRRWAPVSNFGFFRADAPWTPCPQPPAADLSSPSHPPLSSSDRRWCSRCRCRVRGHVCPRGAGGYGARAGG